MTTHRFIISIVFTLLAAGNTALIFLRATYKPVSILQGLFQLTVFALVPLMVAYLTVSKSPWSEQ